VAAAVSEALSDRRLALRVSIEQPLRAWHGLHALDVTIRDVSLTGCRLHCPEPLTASATLWLWLPGGLGGRFRYPVRGDVIWAESVPGERTGVCQVAVQFRPLFAGTTPRIRRALEQLLSKDAERRDGGKRVPYERRIIARGAGRPRILIGQDLSIGGMRIANDEGLELGAEVQVALHAGGALVPIVVGARVVRLTGGGAGLEFTGVDPGCEEQLRKLVSEHPRLIGSDGGAAVVSEIVPGE
jgi:hypothetical protein